MCNKCETHSKQFDMLILMSGWLVLKVKDHEHEWLCKGQQRQQGQTGCGILYMHTLKLGCFFLLLTIVSADLTLNDVELESGGKLVEKGKRAGNRAKEQLKRSGGRGENRKNSGRKNDGL